MIDEIDETALMESCPTVQDVSLPRDYQTFVQETTARFVRTGRVTPIPEDDASADDQSNRPEQPYAYPVEISPPRQRVILILLAFGSFCVGASVSLQAPFFPHEGEAKGMTPIQCGFVFSVFELTIFVFGPIFAKIVPIITPRFMLLAGLFYVGWASILFGFLKMSPPSPFLGLAIAIRIVEGVGTAAYQTSVFTIVAAEFPENLATIYSRTKELAMVACSVICVSLLLLGPAPFLPMPNSLLSVCIALALFGFGSGGTIVCSFAGSFRDTLERGFPDNVSTYGLVSSVFTSSHSIGAFVGPSLGGYLLDTVGYRTGTAVLLANEVILVGVLSLSLQIRRSVFPKLWVGGHER
ncbi:unnamed protein product [Ixodes hexagonus]